MSRTAHARPGHPGTPNHRYPGGSNGAAWRNRYAPHWERAPSPAERPALALVQDGDEHDVWTEPLSAEDKIPGYSDWRLWEAYDWQYERDGMRDYDYYDPYDSDYGYDNYGPRPEDASWIALWVDGYEDTPYDWRWNDDSCACCEYEPDDDDGDWDAIADEIANGPASLPTHAELHLDIPRVLERQVRRNRRRAARAA